MCALPLQRYTKLVMVAPSSGGQFGSDRTPHSQGRPFASGYGCVLLVERDELGKQALEKALLKEGLQMLWAQSSSEAELLASTRRPGLILLNPRLAPEDGWLAYRRLLRLGVPIMVLAGAAPAVRRVALSLGAAECLGTATPPQDIAIRVRRMLGRAPASAGAPATYAGIHLDLSRGLARLGDREASLTPSECAVLAALIEARGRVIAREQLVQRARAAAGALPLARSIDAHVRALRQKLGDDPQRPALIEAVRGFGYRLAAPDAPALESLAEAAFALLPSASLVVDIQGRIQLMNRQAEALLGGGKGAKCAELLGCGVEAPDDPCPGRRALQTGAAQCVRHSARLHHTQTVVEETAVSLPDSPGYFVLELREVGGD